MGRRSSRLGRRSSSGVGGMSSWGRGEQLQGIVGGGVFSKYRIKGKEEQWLCEQQ